MIKRIAHIIIWLLLVSWFVVIMGFVSRIENETLCGEIVIQIADSSQVQFMTRDAVRELIVNSGINTQGYPVHEIDIRSIEFLLEKEPYVSNAEVYINVEGNLFVDIYQRRPLVRVMPGGKNGFYIDNECMILPLSENYSPMVLLCSGNFSIPEREDRNGMKRADVLSDPELEKLIGFARMVEKHPFWSKQIMQIYRSAEGEYELIPRIGAHQIELGSLDNYETKLQNLQLLYDQGLKQHGWNLYDKINLKYSNQIICTKR